MALSFMYVDCRNHDSLRTPEPVEERVHSVAISPPRVKRARFTSVSRLISDPSSVGLGVGRTSSGLRVYLVSLAPVTRNKQDRNS